MSKTFNKHLDVWISEDASRTMSKPLVQRLVHDWLESFNYNLDAEITATIENFSAVNVFNLESPLAYVDHFISEGWKLNMTMILSKFINAFFCEDSLNKVVSIWN